MFVKYKSCLKIKSFFLIFLKENVFLKLKLSQLKIIFTYFLIMCLVYFFLKTLINSFLIDLEIKV